MKNWNDESPKSFNGTSITEEEYRDVLGNVYKRNKEVLTGFSLIVAFLFAVMFVLSFFSKYEHPKQIMYGAMLAVELGFFALYKTVKDHKGNITFLNYFFFVVIYAYSTVITIMDPDVPAVAFHIFLILVPEILIDRPARIITFISLATVAFGVSVYYGKPLQVASIDICNAAWVLFLSIVLTTQHVKLRITGLVVRQKIESERDRDSLTGFFTKKASKREVQHKMENHADGAFVFLDIDNFKQINDTYGHDFGDEVLRKLADYLASYNHTNEVCGRFGGDEFLVYIPDYNNKEAVFQRVHFLLDNLKNNLDYPELNVHPKLSAGIAFYPEDGKDYDELLRNADSAMYYSKHHGKARVTAYSETTTQMASTTK